MPGFKGVAQIQKKKSEAVLHCQVERWSDVGALQSTKGNTEGSVFLFDMPLFKFNKSLTSLLLLEPIATVYLLASVPSKHLVLERFFVMVILLYSIIGRGSTNDQLNDK